MPAPVTPAGFASAQARIQAIEARFAVPSPSAPTATTATRGGSDFEAVLATARTEAAGPSSPAALSTLDAPCCATGVHGGPHVHSTEMGAAGPPPELAAYGNGRIPASALAPIGQGQHRLWEPAATAFQRMAQAAARDGITIRVTDSYRSYDQQVDVAARKGIYGQGGLAARPGTSNHGWGRSLDVDASGATGDWLRANAPTFGYHEDVPGEPWHWTYRPA